MNRRRDLKRLELACNTAKEKKEPLVQDKKDEEEGGKKKVLKTFKHSYTKQISKKLVSGFE